MQQLGCHVANKPTCQRPHDSLHVHPRDAVGPRVGVTAPKVRKVLVLWDDLAQDADLGLAGDRAVIVVEQPIEAVE